MNTPQGVRAQQVMDMLNSDWPIGTASVTTLATAEMVDPIEAVMERLWWDRPYTLTGVDIGAGSARLHLISSFGAQQDIELRTDDQTKVSRLVVDTHEPAIGSWQDVDTALERTGARYSWMVSEVASGDCVKVAGANTGESLPLASIFKTYVLFAVEEALGGPLGADPFELGVGGLVAAQLELGEVVGLVRPRDRRRCRYTGGRWHRSSRRGRGRRFATTGGSRFRHRSAAR